MIATCRSTFFVLFLLQTTAFAQNDCEWLLKYGIYDTSTTTVSAYQYEHIKQLVKTSNAGSRAELKSRATSVGLGIDALLDFSFGGQRSDQNFEQWKQSFLNTEYREFIKNESMHTAIRTVSSNLMEAVKTCLERRRSFHAWVEPSSDYRTFTVSLRYNTVDPNPRKLEITSLAVTATTEGELLPLHSDHAKLIKKGATIDPNNGIAIIYQRAAPSDTVTVTVNTSKGEARMEIPPYIPDDPKKLISRLEARVRELEVKYQQIASLLPPKVSITKFQRLVSFGNQYAHVEPNGRFAGIETAVVPANAAWKVQFNAPPGFIIKGAWLTEGHLPHFHNGGQIQNAVGTNYLGCTPINDGQAVEVGATHGPGSGSFVVNVAALIEEKK